MNLIKELEQEQMASLPGKQDIPEFAPGDTLKVNVKVKEGDRERIQAFEGVCIAKNGGGLKETFTVRKISFGEGVERVFPIYSALVDSIVVVRRGKVRRAKLYYLRDRRGKSARIAEKVDRRPAEDDGAVKETKTAKRAAKRAKAKAEREAVRAEREAAAKAKAEAAAAEKAAAEAAAAEGAEGGE